jgi:hypothetical protein
VIIAGRIAGGGGDAHQRGAGGRRGSAERAAAPEAIEGDPSAGAEGEQGEGERPEVDGERRRRGGRRRRGERVDDDAELRVGDYGASDGLEAGAVGRIGGGGDDDDRGAFGRERDVGADRREGRVVGEQALDLAGEGELLTGELAAAGGEQRGIAIEGALVGGAGRARRRGRGRAGGEQGEEEEAQGGGAGAAGASLSSWLLGHVRW